MDVDPVVAWRLEDQLRINLDSDDSGSEDSDHLPLEWEAVRKFYLKSVINMLYCSFDYLLLSSLHLFLFFLYYI